MDFGVVSRKHTSPNASCLGSNEPRNGKAHGSANLKHQRSGLAEDYNYYYNSNNNNSWRLSKTPTPSEVDFSSKKSSESFSSPFGRSNLWPSPDDEDGQKMLSFSSDEPRRGGGSSRSIAFSICEDEQYHSRMGGGGPNGGIRGPFARLKGPFTPSQWMELEHQALIYKHIMANVPVPSNLLVPLKRSIYSYGPYASNLMGWGPFHIGYSSSNDPEPGRCRRTDGKKWRCSRDAVPDQKYCERHINRGRHRSRKPVEGHNTVGHANANANANVSSSNKVPLIPINNASSSSSSAAVMSATNASSSNNSLCAMQRQFDSLQQQPNSVNNIVSRSQELQGLSLVPPTIGLKPKDSLFPVQKQHATFQESSSSSPNSEFGIVSSDSLLNPSERIIPYMNSSSNTNTSDSFLQFNSKETRNHNHSVHHFIDDWPKADHHQSEELKSDWTQLSMSIPTMAAPDSPVQAKPVSSLRLSHELDPFHMSLGMSHDFINEPVQKQPAWLPVTWGNPVGGPLGEVLSSQIGSSPTGVLQKSTFVSFSNSSSVSSPTSGDNRKSDLLGMALLSSTSIPSL